MKIELKPFFKEFTWKHYGPREVVKQALQYKQIEAEVKKPGKFERSLETQDGDAVIVYYYYDGKDTLYVLAAHLDRKGEPGPTENRAVEKYIKEIENR